MKLSISNIAWGSEQDEEIYKYLQDSNFSGLEIAPTRIFPENPYDNAYDAKKWAEKLYAKYNLNISSMQSIWYGKTESIFGTKDEQNSLLDYTKKAIDFAAAIECKNLVFGCPKNRNIPSDKSDEYVYDFFKTLAEYAHKNNTVIALEPNPPIYGTNFINTTKQAFELVKALNVEGLAVNVDFGTITNNNEDLDIIAENLSYVNHIHISEPNLAEIEKRAKHIELKEILVRKNYDKFISIEMKNLNNLEPLKKTIDYIGGIFGEI